PSDESSMELTSAQAAVARVVDPMIAANCLSFGREIALSFSSSNARIHISIRRNNQAPMISMWGKFTALAPRLRRDSGPPLGLGGVIDHSDVRGPARRDCAVVATDAIPRKAGGGNGCRRLILI